MTQRQDEGQERCDPRGCHPYINVRPDEQNDEDRLPKEVFAAEVQNINRRRKRNGKSAYDPDCCQPTGVALSGSGIRSASFCLGALQALQASPDTRVDHIDARLEGIDYLSTVSGGGYVGCALVASLQNLDGKFPFTSADPQVYSDTPSVRHIRDYSNYLIPHGAWDVVTALAIIGRGLVANALIILPILLFCVGLTLALHPDRNSLADLASFRITFGLLAVAGGFLAFWAVAKSIAATHFWQKIAEQKKWSPGHSAELHGGFVTISQALFVLIIGAFFIEIQPFILKWMSDSHGWQPPREWPQVLTLGSLGALVTMFSKYLGDVIAITNRATGWLPQLKKIAAMAALWFAAIVIPLCLWLVYINVTYAGLDRHWAKPFLVAAVVAALVALTLDPNVTSLYRLYRDRLSKAFLFDPNPKSQRDKYHDLPAYQPKLHQLDTRLCPYPIINAALNIEGSRYANKRGRDADFFVFTPEYTGSQATGYIGTQNLEKSEAALDLGTAMAISAAAVSANMGAETIKPLTFTLALLNARLGYWLLNPSKVSEPKTLLKRIRDVRVLSLFMEMFSRLEEDNHLVYLTDGGHIENLGVYSLLKRHCKLIIAIDAEADPRMGFGSLLQLERYARIDLGVLIDLPWGAVRDCALATDAAFDEAKTDGSPVPSAPGPHCAAGRINYGGKETGILLYVKASLSGDESDYLLDYKRRHGAFPHETTGDQFFGEEQLEAYRALGFHIVQGMLTDTSPFAVVLQAGETEHEARKRVRAEIRAALGADEKTIVNRG
jgi:hypothetical protein